jgi:OOP family OmpA-OmpF porin
MAKNYGIIKLPYRNACNLYKALARVRLLRVNKRYDKVSLSELIKACLMMTRSLFQIAAVSALIVLSGSGAAQAGVFSGIHDTDSARGLPAAGVEFTQNLYKEYIALSKDRANRGDAVDGELFNHKGLLAQRRAGVQIETVHDRKLTNQQRTVFYQATNRLNFVYDAGGRELAPLETAVGQVAFDCWIEAEERNDKKDADGCKKKFEDAMAAAEQKVKYSLGQVDVPAPQPAPAPAPAVQVPPQEYYILPFEFDSTVMTPDGEAQLRKAIGDLKNLDQLKISIRAHADRSGSDSYNVKLSRRRAEAVLNRLSGAGIPQQRLRIVEAVGESRSLVPTADGVKEQGNRVVELDLRQ